jgi:hypothetical protein
MTRAATSASPSRRRLTAAERRAAQEAEAAKVLDDGTADVPVFGTDAPDYEDLPRHPFEVEVQDVSTADRKRVRFPFVAVGQPDGGAVIAFSASQRRKGDEGAQAGASIRVLLTMLDDSDGVPSSWNPTPVQDDPEQPPSEWLAYDGEAFPTPGGALPELEEESSRRRFLHIVDDDRYHLPLSTVTALARYLIKQGTAPRPTNRPTR